MKFCRDNTSENLDMSKFKIYLFDNRKPEEFLMFVQIFNMTIDALGTLTYNAKLQYIHTLVHGEALCQFDTFLSSWKYYHGTFKPSHFGFNYVHFPL